MFTEMMMSASGGGTYVETVLSTSTPYVVQNVSNGAFFVKNSDYDYSNALRIAIENSVVKENAKNAGDFLASYDATTHTLTFSKVSTSSYGGTHTLYGCYS